MVTSATRVGDLNDDAPLRGKFMDMVSVFCKDGTDPACVFVSLRLWVLVVSEDGGPRVFAVVDGSPEPWGQEVVPEMADLDAREEVWSLEVGSEQRNDFWQSDDVFWTRLVVEH